MPYDVFTHLDLLDAVPGGGARRRRMIDLLSRLREQPHTTGDYTDKDDSLRERQVKVVDDCAVTYWVDHAVRAVMVVDIQPAGR